MIDREIDLIIRAQIEKGRDLESITKSIEKLESAIEQQASAAKRGEGSIDSLKATLLELQQVQDRLRSTGKLVTDYQKLSETIERTRERVESTAAAYTKYADKLKTVETITDAQQARQNKLAKSSENAQKRLDVQTQSLEKLKAALTGVGVDINDLSAAQERMLQTGARLGLTLNRTSEAISSYAEDMRAAKAAAQQLAQVQAEQAKQQALFAAAEKRYADAQARRDADYEEYKQAIANRNAKIAADRRAAQEEEERTRRSRELAELRVDIERRSAQQVEDIARKGEAAAAERFEREKRAEKARAEELSALRADILERSKQSDTDAGLRKTADEAQQAAKGYNTLSRAATSLTPKVKSLREAVDKIIDPARAARANLSGLEGEIKTLSRTVRAINGPIDNYRDLLGRLVNAQKELSRQSGLVDNFREQLTALRSARQEYVQARAQVLQYAQAVKQGGEAGAQYVKSLQDAQVRARQAAQALAQQVQATRTARTAVRDAGIATNDLAGAQQRLNAGAVQTTKTMRQLTAANQQYAGSVERATKAKGLFRDEGRTTLSYVQRLRGEVLSLAAAFGGIFGAVNLARQSIDALISQQGIENRIAVGLGTNDSAAIAKEFEYVEKSADRLGFGVKDLANSYSSYLVAAKNANLENDQTKYIFEQVTGAMRVLKLNTDQSSRAWVQLNQILSKARPEMEDIKTIAESGFVGVQTTMAKGLREIGVAGIRAGTEVNDMFELMKKGSLDSRTAIFALAAGAEKDYKGRLADAIKTVQAEQGRFQTQVFNFQKELANSGWADAYTDALKEIAEFLKSDAGSNLAQTASAGFTALARALIWVLENLDALKVSLYAIGATVAIKGIAGLIAYLVRLRAVAFGAATGVMTLSRALTLLNVAAAAITLAYILYKEFDSVRKVIDSTIAWIAGAFAALKVGLIAVVENLPALYRNYLAAILNTVTLFARRFLGIFAKIAGAVGLDGIEKALAETAQTLEIGYANVANSFAATTERMKAEFARVRDETKAALAAQKDAREEVAGGSVGDGITETARPNAPGRTNPGEDPAKAAAKRARLIEELQRSIEAIEARIDRAQTETLSTQLDAIDKQYAALKRKIGTLGGEEGAEFKRRLDEAIGNLRTQTIKRFNDGLAKEREALDKKLDQLDAAAGRKERLSLKARQDAITLQYASYYRELEELRDKFVANGRDTSDLDSAKARLDGGVAELQRLEAIKFAQEELNRREQRQNDLIQNREKLIANVRAQQEAGNIDDVEAARQINVINAQAIPTIEAAAAATKEWAIANAAIFQTPEDMQVFLSTLDAVVAKIKTIPPEYDKVTQTVIGGSVELINNGLNGIVDGFRDIVTGQKSVSEGFRGMLVSFGQFVASFLRDIALMIIKLMIFNALANSGNPVLAAVGNAGRASMGVRHSGGIVGTRGGRTRRVSTDLFAGAPRYHSGGLVGLRSDEYPSILQRGEEVLAADSPRNILNGGAGVGGAAAKSERGLRIVMVDDRAKVPEAMASAEGDDVIVQSIRRNAPTIKQFLK